MRKLICILLAALVLCTAAGCRKVSDSTLPTLALEEREETTQPTTVTTGTTEAGEGTEPTQGATETTEPETEPTEQETESQETTPAETESPTEATINFDNMGMIDFGDT